MPPWPRTVLFDFDGVIVNSEPLHFHAFHEVLEAEQIQLTEQEYYHDLIGFDDRGAFKHLFKKRDRELAPGTLLALLTRKSQLMMQLIHRRQFNALPGVEEFVRSLWRKMPLAICSGALREEIEAMLEAVSLRDCFPIIVAAEDVKIGKPDPEGYLLAAKLVGEKSHHAMQPADCLVVEDAPTVIRSVRDAGFRVLGIATTYGQEKLQDADWQVDSLRPDEVMLKVPQLKALISEENR